MADAIQPTGPESQSQPAKPEPRKETPARGESQPARASGASAAATSGNGQGFFTIYKKGQGYWTRIGTVMGAALIAILTAEFIYTRLKIHTNLSTNALIIVDAVFIALFGLITFRITNRPKVVDFLIATDSEMKKVNWTTKKELIGSTKVVIFFMLIIMLLLFTFDTIFGYVFYAINVLKFTPF
jgi:preprotein translocase SecE subunit